jgi:hypothetical protein
MKTKIILALLLAPSLLLADDFTIRVASFQDSAGLRTVTLGVSGTDSNHVYGVYRRFDLTSTNTVLVNTNFIGTDGAEFFVEDVLPVSTNAAFYQGKQEDGFLVWSVPIPDVNNVGSCPGSYIGLANYIKSAPAFGWNPDTNNTTIFVATDGTGRTDTKFIYAGRFGDTGCGAGSVTVPFPPVSSAYRFTIYFPTNLPSGAYPLRLIGFVP